MTVGEPSPGGESRRWRGGHAVWVAAVLAAAIVPGLLALDTPLISDDGAALGYVHREGPWADWGRPQYDLRSVRFWRPLVTTSLGLQLAATGVAPEPLRVLNIAGHALAAVLFGVLALRLGGGRVGALVAGLLAAGYPEQGGNVVWIAGRVDSQCVPFLLLACVLALDGRQALACVAGFGALATKELAVVMPVWVFLLAWGRGEALRAALRRAAPLGLLLVLVLLWRRHCLGVWIGGYPDESRSLGLALAGPVARNLAGVLGVPALVAIVATLVPGAVAPATRVRRFAALLACAVVAALPMVHLLSGEAVGEEHLRTFWLADGALALAVGAAVRYDPRRGARLALVAAALGFGLWRMNEAVTDAYDWQRGGLQAARELRWPDASSQPVPPGEQDRYPEVDDFSRITDAGAYVLHWGVADRYRAPFPERRHPMWPWRPVFDLPGAQRQTGGTVVAGPAHFVEPDGTQREEGPHGGLHAVLEAADGELRGSYTVGADWLVSEGGVDPSPRVDVLPRPEWPSAAYELLLITELGYRAAAIPGSSEDGATFTLREALMLTSDAFLLALDFGAEYAYLEVRGLPPPGGRIGATYWLRLEWDVDELRPLLLPLE